MSIKATEIVYDFTFTAKNKPGEYFFNRYMKTHPFFIEVKKENNIYTGFSTLGNIMNLSKHALYKYGKIDTGVPHLDKTIIACN